MSSLPTPNTKKMRITAASSARPSKTFAAHSRITTLTAILKELAIVDGVRVMQNAPGPSGMGRKNVANEANEEQEWLTSLLSLRIPTLHNTSEYESAYSASYYTATTNSNSSTDARAHRRDKNKNKNKESKKHQRGRSSSRHSRRGGSKKVTCKHYRLHHRKTNHNTAITTARCHWNPTYKGYCLRWV